ncbi:glycosyltransferase family 2 protein [Rhodopirellula sp. P2]|uniref:glycosyltransferase family 2 protein n=1 Tax=Rhodopirellula sp. P2 TaxID=2127060 RepID=UPI002368C610|nr:glycosyltransferase family 2 protein [Rhodopirellula sp. P2]WDQ17417.1 glycosyltransferase family 2 protein [Rhodopirellula sp. P2]
MIISLIIPTRERVEYLKESIQTALRVKDDQFEIIVSDNASNDTTQEVIASIQDSRLKYVNTGERVSMRQNFEFSLQQCSGDYVIYIGDDDCFLADQFPFLRRILEQHTPDALSWDRPTYGWPITGYGKHTGSVKFQRNSLYGEIEKIDCDESKQRLLACNLGALGPKPAIYHGCISRRFLRSIETSEGVCFASSNPDVYVTYQAVLQNANAMHVAHPFTLNGYSPASTGGAHHSFKTGDPRRQPAHLWRKETKQDPLCDVLGCTLTVPHAFFSTLETIRTNSPREIEKPDYRAWYHYVLNSPRPDDYETQRMLAENIAAYAEQTGTQKELAEAGDTTVAVAGKIKKYSQRIEKLRTMMHRKRISAEIDGKNNALTAALTYDRVLGDDYAGILDGSRSRSLCWKAAMQRSRETQSIARAA